MRQVRLSRINRVYSTHQIVWDNVLDYTHFLFAHKKHFVDFDVLFDDGTLQVFSYISRIFPPLPLTKHFVSVRVFDHESFTMKQVYKEVGKKNGQCVFFRTTVVPQGDIIEVHNKFVFNIYGVWENIPNLLIKILHRRFKSMWEEDAVCSVYRKNHGKFDHEECVPAVSNLHHEYLKNFEDKMDDSKADPNALTYKFSFEPVKREAE